MYILKISYIKSVKIIVTTIAKIIDTKNRIQNVLNRQITGIRKMSAKLFKIFLTFCKIFLKQFV